MNLQRCLLTLIFSAGTITQGEFVHEKNADPENASFRFKKVDEPTQGDLASRSTLTIVDGEKDANGGALEKLIDGKLPTEDDQPSENFFFDPRAKGGRILMDLGQPEEIGKISHAKPNVKELRPYYEDLIAEYFPAKLRW